MCLLDGDLVVEVDAVEGRQDRRLFGEEGRAFGNGHGGEDAEVWCVVSKLELR